MVNVAGCNGRNGHGRPFQASRAGMHVDTGPAQLQTFVMNGSTRKSKPQVETNSGENLQQLNFSAFPEYYTIHIKYVESRRMSSGFVLSFSPQKRSYVLWRIIRPACGPSPESCGKYSSGGSSPSSHSKTGFWQSPHCSCPARSVA